MAKDNGKEQIGITELSALTQWVNTVTKGVYNVEFVNGAETAAINGNKMILPMPNSDMTLRDAIRLRGFCLHETSHPLYQSKAFDILGKFPMAADSPLRAIYNMMLDVHAETSRAEEYPGDKKALSEFGAVLARDVSDGIIDKVPHVKEGDDNAKVLALMHRSMTAESQWNTGLRSGSADLLEAMPQHVKDISEKVEDKFDLNYRLTDPRETAETLWELARNVFSYLWEKDPETEKQSASGGKGEGEEGDGEGDEKGEGSPENQDGDGEMDPEAEGKKGGDPKKGKLKVREMVWTEHYEGEKIGDYGHGKSMDFSDYTEHPTYTPYPEPDFEVIDYDKVTATPHKYREFALHDSKSAPGFVSDLRRLLQVESQATYSQGYRSGKLSASRLWRIGAPPIDEGRWNESVFKRKTEVSDVMDTCVSLLVDASGSMGGGKYEHAYRAAAMLNDTLTTVLRIPVEIHTFSSDGDRPVMGIIKKFSKAVTPIDLHRRFLDFIHHMNGNNDADSISWVYNRLRYRKEKRKILIVFSDGSPADGNGDPYYALKKVVKEIEGAGIVDIYGIGICSQAVTHFYSQRATIDDASEIGRTLISVLRKAIHK